MEIIKSDTDYAVRLLVELTGYAHGEPVPASMLAQAQAVPLDFAYKLLQKLGRAGIVRRARGSRGGFALALNPEDISLLEVTAAIQGPLVVRKCALGKEACPRQPSCPVSGKLKKLQVELVRALGNISLREIIADDSAAQLFDSGTSKAI